MPPADGATAARRLVALLGHPVAHSVSPQIHTAAFAAAGVDAAYLAFDVAPEHLGAAVAGLAALGALGANVTVPHKPAALALADEVRPEAAEVGAANTLSFSDGRLVADNTDAPGLVEVLRGEAGLRDGESVLLFGAGGAAAAAAVALGRCRAVVEVVARRVDAAEEVAARVESAGGRIDTVAAPRLVLNASSLGLHGEPLPERCMHLGAGQVALDLVYGPAPTPFLAAADAGGATAVDGVGLLVAQAALSFERWTGRPAPRQVMAAAAARALGRPPPGAADPDLSGGRRASGARGAAAG